jgi:D-alanine-D-alanine ligase
LRVAVLHDLVAPEAPADLADNLVQAREVSRALLGLGHRPEMVALGPNSGDTARRLAELRPGLVFNLCETPLGQARLIHLAPLLLDRLGLAYTGAGPRAMLASSNKLWAKRLMLAKGIATPGWARAPLPASPPAPGDWLVKSVWEHGSVGLDAGSLVPGGQWPRVSILLEAKRRELGGEWFAERFIRGREFNLSLLAGSRGPVVLPAAEIAFRGFARERPRLVGWRAKWDPTSWESRATPRRFALSSGDRPLADRLARIALKCWRAFGLRGWARVDFRVDQAGRPWVLEVNANPCLAPDAGFMAAARAAGLDAQAVIARILAHPKAPEAPAPRSAAGSG